MVSLQKIGDGSLFNEETRPQKQPLFLIFIIFVLAIVFRVVFLVHYEMIETDSAYYGNIARLFAMGHWQKALDPYWSPLYPFLTSLFFRIGFPLETSGLFVSILASAGTLILCFILGKFIGGYRIGFISACLAAIHPRLIVISQTFLTEPLFLFLSFGSLASFCYAYEVLANKKQRYALGSLSVFLMTGILLGLAFLTRTEGVFYLMFCLLVGILSLICALIKKGVKPKFKLSQLLCLLFMLIGFALVSFVYISHVTQIAGRFTLGEKAEANFYLAYRDDYRQAGMSVAFSDYRSITRAELPRQSWDYRVFEFVRQHPEKIIKKTFPNVARSLLDKIPSLMYWPLFLFSMFGIFFRKSMPRSRYELLFAGWLLIPVFIYSPLFLYRRFFVSTLPILIIWCAMGLKELGNLMPRKIFRIVLVLGTVLLIFLANVSLSSRSWPILYKEAGLWLKEHATKPIILSGRKPETSFYAEAEFRPLEVQHKDDLQYFLKNEGITHLIVEDYILPDSNPGLAYLLDPKNAQPWLHPVYSSTKNGHTLLIYEFNPDTTLQY